MLAIIKGMVLLSRSHDPVYHHLTKSKIPRYITEWGHSECKSPGDVETRASQCRTYGPTNHIFLTYSSSYPKDQSYALPRARHTFAPRSRASYALARFRAHPRASVRLPLGLLVPTLRSRIRAHLSHLARPRIAHARLHIAYARLRARYLLAPTSARLVDRVSLHLIREELLSVAVLWVELYSRIQIPHLQRAFTASALCNLMPATPNKPSLMMYRGTDAVCEYDNPDLIPGMFPTLFPFGIGGFDDKTRRTPLGFRRQIEYTLDLADKSFRYHRTYMFVTLNIWQRRMAHLHTHFTVHRAHFDTLAKSLASVNTVAARIPGSQSSKIHIWNEIRSYFGIVVSTTVDLTQRYPVLVSARERALRLAQDPVAAADFFQFCVKALFAHLFGWDFETATSTPTGGILGHLEAFYGTSEFTERGSLHGHFVIWLLGGLNPTELHSRLNDPLYQAQFFAYFEDIIHHHLPDIELDVDPSFEPRTQRPPVPLDLSLIGQSPQSVLNEWESVMATDVLHDTGIMHGHNYY
ncbi:uncharacterized protein HD556DRAFT_1449792 [Suillus plorans]|uniref:Helitron helicase-like domain-containing protein n=1 Tax=Suillus plorans TaxID=116603 RepID=A0A9P7DB79_9AGAM|nr:uncharacterized protein HD556DRAFT_1449792 [Suillus plorans]KAG1786292.1 hypothetical protein HD556DRAFT_1449792 [Suillus plorans]